jgi:DNA-directed RNA polymerase specialized sigma54-like protein
MALSQRLEFRQSQALVMTPQLMQAIKLLQLSSLDLAAYVEGELERNPLLERTSDEQARAPMRHPRKPITVHPGALHLTARRRRIGPVTISRPAAPR